MMIKLLSLAVGGVSGAFARYFLTNVIGQLFGSHFPHGTLFVNALGCFVIGFLAALGEEKLFLSTNMQLLLIVGFCGAFTTFSAFMIETAHLIKAGETFKAFLNVTLSLLIGFLLFHLGVLLASKLPFSFQPAAE